MNVMNVKEWHAHPPGFYYDLIAPFSARVDIWETEYQHVLPNAEAVMEWYKGTGLRPFLEALHTNLEREQFLAEYLKRIGIAYPPHPERESSLSVPPPVCGGVPEVTTLPSFSRSCLNEGSFPSSRGKGNGS